MRLLPVAGFKPALNSKGLRPAAEHAIRAKNGLQASPEFKGIKTQNHRQGRQTQCFKPALNSKGLRRNWLRSPRKINCFKPALNSKGLRRGLGHPCCAWQLQASPEFKGIKTGYAGVNRSRHKRFKPALNSKGLRLRPTVNTSTTKASSQP